MAVLKSADFRSRNIFSEDRVVEKATEAMKADYLKLAQTWQRWNRNQS